MMILDLMTKLFQNKWVRNGILIAAFLGVLYICAASIRDNIYQEGYSAGVAHQEQVELQVQVKAKQEWDVLQATADKDRASLNQQIATLSKNNQALKSQLADKERKTNQEKIDYAKTSAGTMSCFAPNDSGLFIINNSFPSYPDRPVQSGSDGAN